MNFQLRFFKVVEFNIRTLICVLNFFETYKCHLFFKTTMELGFIWGVWWILPFLTENFSGPPNTISLAPLCLYSLAKILVPAQITHLFPPNFPCRPSQPANLIHPRDAPSFLDLSSAARRERRRPLLAQARPAPPPAFLFPSPPTTRHRAAHRSRHSAPPVNKPHADPSPPMSATNQPGLPRIIWFLSDLPPTRDGMPCPFSARSCSGAHPGEGRRPSPTPTPDATPPDQGGPWPTGAAAALLWHRSPAPAAASRRNPASPPHNAGEHSRILPWPHVPRSSPADADAFFPSVRVW